MIKEFKMTQIELDIILQASKPVPFIMLQCGLPKSPQKNVNNAWQDLAKEKGFIWDTVKPISGKSQLFFTAET